MEYLKAFGAGLGGGLFGFAVVGLLYLIRNLWRRLRRAQVIVGGQPYCTQHGKKHRS